MSNSNTNWAGNVVYAARALHQPNSIEQVQQLVRDGGKIRALGSRHSFNTIADTTADLVSMRGLNRVISIDPDARTVTAEGGITYGELCPVLHSAGFALHNLASLPHISVAGACSTATHGSGVGNANLATAVSALDIVTATGEIVTLKRGDPDFAGAVVGLGALGIVARITLDIQPAFSVSQTLFTGLPVADFVANFDAIASAAYSVSFFTTWSGDAIEQVWLKALDGQPAPTELFGARPATRPWHPIAAIDPAPCTEQMGVPGPSHLRLPHFRLEFTPSVGAEIQSEYFVARRDAVAAFEALRAIQHLIAPPLLISEIRTIAADELWLSMNYRQDSLAFHFTFTQDWPAVQAVLPHIEAALAPFAPRPHWGKVFAMPAPRIQSRYERLGDFRSLAHRLDPEAKFRNAFVNDTLF